jgi:hypothetical protein
MFDYFPVVYHSKTGKLDSFRSRLLQAAEMKPVAAPRKQPFG